VLQINNPAIGFLSKPGLGEIRSLVWSLSGRTATGVPPYLVGVAVTFAFALVVARRDLHSVETFRFALPLLWLILPPLILMSASYVHPIWLDRYAFWSLDAVVLLAAYGLTRIARGPLLGALVVVTVALATRGIVNWYDAPPNQDYRSAMTQLSPQLRTGDAIIFTPDEVRLPAEFYLRNLINLHELTPVFPAQAWGHFKTGDETIASFSRAALHQALSVRYPRLWVVADVASTAKSSGIGQLRSQYRTASDRHYEGHLEVTLLTSR
jgi:hypothetical protein